MKIITRQEATAQGLIRYYTGKPCKHGHLSERRRDNGTCIECLNVYQQAYGQTEQRKEANRKNQQRYQQSAKGKARDRKKQNKRYAESPHRYVAGYIKGKYPSAMVPLTEVEQQRVEGIYRFANALRQRTNHGWDVDHCYPLSRGGVHHPDNLQVLPASVNRQKRDKVDPANPSVLKGFLASFPHAAERLKQKRKAGRTPLMIGEMNKGQRVRPAL